jgi:hypothetical protein
MGEQRVRSRFYDAGVGSYWSDARPDHPPTKRQILWEVALASVIEEMAKASFAFIRSESTGEIDP